MTTARYKFERASGAPGFLSTNSPSTDALNALGEWQDAHPERECDSVRDEGDCLIADLSWAECSDSVGRELDDACQKYGVERSFVDS
jgi:hypothetical protein